MSFAYGMGIGETVRGSHIRGYSSMESSGHAKKRDLNSAIATVPDFGVYMFVEPPEVPCPRSTAFFSLV